MKSFLGLIVLLTGLWLALWISNYGVLVYSAGTKVPMTRDCRYFIGVSVVKRIEPLAERCLVIRKI